jgi:uncharacterized protein (DUF2267 family)
MNYDHFVGQVQHRARLASEGAAVRAIQATLQTLSERLDPHEAKDLAAQLPREFAIYFEGADHCVRMSLDDFLHRVSEREHQALPQAIYHARVVVEVLKEAVSQGEIRDVRSQLPREYAALFDAGSRGQFRKADPVPH